MRHVRFVRWVGWMVLSWALASVPACRSIVGIDEHRFVEDAGPSSSASSCDGYCDAVLANCSEPGLQAFKNSRDDCMALCSFLPPGSKPDETSGDSVSCREHYARLAVGSEADVQYCPAASPGGGSPGDSPSCGDNCDAYCSVYKQVCPEDYDDKCDERCEALPDAQSFSAEADFAGGDDTIQCRVAHLTAAARSKVNAQQAKDETTRSNENKYRMLHCGHSRLRPALLADDNPCDLKAEQAPNCEDYCKLIQVACTSDNRVYDDAEQCLAVCRDGFPTPEGVPLNQPDESQGTLSCRRWHAYYALTSGAEEHCPHAGPGGAGHCGEICPVYCAMLAQSPCKSRYEAAFATPEACAQKCLELDFGGDKSRYSVLAESVRTNTYQCRLHQLSLAFAAGDAAKCDHVLPADSCPN